MEILRKDIMIYVCEPQCKSGSHESFNSGFLHGLGEIYNDIYFYAEKTHIIYIKSYLSLRNSSCIKKINYKEITFLNNINDFRQLFFYYKIFNNIFKRITENDKILFLSTNPMALFILNKLVKKQKYKNIILNIVLHGGIEELIPIQKNNLLANTRLNIISSKPLEKNNKVIYFIKKIYRFVRYRIKAILLETYNSLNHAFFNYKSFFSNKRDLSSFNFIVLSKHILNNLHINNSTFKMKLCFLPCIFPLNPVEIKNDYPKLAIFGYGTGNGLFEEFLEKLDNLNPSKKYEIRLISTRSYQGIERYKNITLNRSNFIPRIEYEKLAEDIDFFINFYDPSQYRISCPGSILEAIMYRKPVIYIGNECFDSYNSLAGPIGIRAGSTENFALIVFDIIEKWPFERERIYKFKENIEKVINIIDFTTQLKNDSSIIL